MPQSNLSGNLSLLNAKDFNRRGHFSFDVSQRTICLLDYNHGKESFSITNEITNEAPERNKSAKLMDMDTKEYILRLLVPYLSHAKRWPFLTPMKDQIMD